MRKAICILTALALSLLTATGSPHPFYQTYTSAPLYEVLQDIESHFGLQFMYRPADIANALAVTATIQTDDYQMALRQALGQSLQFTERKGIIIITAVPKKNDSQKSKFESRKQIVESPIRLAEPLPQIAATDTLLTDSTENFEREKLQFYAPIALLQPFPPFVVGHIDPARVRAFVMQREQVIKADGSISNTVNSHTSPSSVQQSLDHTFYTSLSVGYGSAANAQLDLRYGLYFHRNWGVGLGLNWQFAAQDSSSTWLQEGRIGIPIALYTRWQFTPKWGLHGALGTSPAFMVYTGSTGTGIAHVATDLVPFAEVDAAYRMSSRTTFLLGLYGRFSVFGTSFEPWAAGLHLGFIFGSK